MIQRSHCPPQVSGQQHGEDDADGRKKQHELASNALVRQLPTRDAVSGGNAQRGEGRVQGQAQVLRSEAGGQEQEQRGHRTSPSTRSEDRRSAAIQSRTTTPPTMALTRRTARERAELAAANQQVVGKRREECQAPVPSARSRGARLVRSVTGPWLLSRCAGGASGGRRRAGAG